MSVLTISVQLAPMVLSTLNIDQLRVPKKHDILCIHTEVLHKSCQCFSSGQSPLHTKLLFVVYSVQLVTIHTLDRQLVDPPPSIVVTLLVAS